MMSSNFTNFSPLPNQQTAFPSAPYQERPITYSNGQQLIGGELREAFAHVQGEQRQLPYPGVQAGHTVSLRGEFAAPSLLSDQKSLHGSPFTVNDPAYFNGFRAFPSNGPWDRGRAPFKSSEQFLPQFAPNGSGSRFSSPPADIHAFNAHGQVPCLSHGSGAVALKESSSSLSPSRDHNGSLLPSYTEGNWPSQYTVGPRPGLGSSASVVGSQQCDAACAKRESNPWPDAAVQMLHPELNDTRGMAHHQRPRIGCPSLAGLQQPCNAAGATFWGSGEKRHTIRSDQYCFAPWPLDGRRQAESVGDRLDEGRNSYQRQAAPASHFSGSMQPPPPPKRKRPAAAVAEPTEACQKDCDRAAYLQAPTSSTEDWLQASAFEAGYEVKANAKHASSWQQTRVRETEPEIKVRPMFALPEKWKRPVGVEMAPVMQRNENGSHNGSFAGLFASLACDQPMSMPECKFSEVIADGKHHSLAPLPRDGELLAKMSAYSSPRKRDHVATKEKRAVYRVNGIPCCKYLSKLLGLNLKKEELDTPHTSAVTARANPLSVHNNTSTSGDCTQVVASDVTLNSCAAEAHHTMDSSLTASCQATASGPVPASCQAVVPCLAEGYFQAVAPGSAPDFFLSAASSPAPECGLSAVPDLMPDSCKETAPGLTAELCRVVTSDHNRVAGESCTRHYDRTCGNDLREANASPSPAGRTPEQTGADLHDAKLTSVLVVPPTISQLLLNETAALHETATKGEEDVALLQPSSHCCEAAFREQLTTSTADDAASAEPSPADLQQHSRLEPPPPCNCTGREYDENAEGPYYTQLGAASSLAEVRSLMERRTGCVGRAVRIEMLRFTGKEGQTSLGCPAAKWVLNRSGEEEKVLVCVRRRVGHVCSTAWLVIAIVCWEGVPAAAANHIYDYLVRTLPVYGYETERRCGTNAPRDCACQGWDVNRRGASFSFGCSWSVYYDGCKFARSERPRKFKLREDCLEELLEAKLQTLSQHVAPLFGVVAPDAYANQAKYEKVASDCRLGFRPGRPFSGVTATVDFCAHAHYDSHNMNNGSTVVVTLTKYRGGPGGGAGESDRQLHVLPLYVLDELPSGSGDANGVRQSTPETACSSSGGSIDHAPLVHKVKAGVIEVLSNQTRELRKRSAPLKRKKKSAEKYPSAKVKEAAMQAMQATSEMALMSPGGFGNDEGSGSHFTANSHEPDRNGLNHSREGAASRFDGIVKREYMDTTLGDQQRSLHVTETQQPALIRNHSTGSISGTSRLLSPDFSSQNGLLSAAQQTTPAHPCNGFSDVYESCLLAGPPHHSEVKPPPFATSPTGHEAAQQRSHAGGDEWQRRQRPRPPSPEIDDPEPRVIREESTRLFADPSVGGVGLALTHGAVLFEVAERELHATTALRQPDRYDPTRISLVFYQHRKLNYRRHGSSEYARAEMRRQQARRDAIERGVPYVPKGLKYKRKRQEEAAMQSAAASSQACRNLSMENRNAITASCRRSLVTPMAAIPEGMANKKKKKPIRFAPYRWCWKEPIKMAAASTTDTVVTKWVKPECFVTGPYQRWISL